MTVRWGSSWNDPVVSGEQQSGSYGTPTAREQAWTFFNSQTGCWLVRSFAAPFARSPACCLSLRRLLCSPLSTCDGLCTSPRRRQSHNDRHSFSFLLPYITSYSLLCTIAQMRVQNFPKNFLALGSQKLLTGFFEKYTQLLKENNN